MKKRLFRAILFCMLCVLSALTASAAAEDEYEIKLVERTAEGFSVALTDSSASEGEVLLIVAAYNNDGRMTGCSVQRSADGSAEAYVACAEGYVKAFVVNSETFTPMIAAWENHTLAPEIPEPVMTKTLVAYFSYSGTTEKIAGYVANAAGADVYRIVPEVPYTDDILKYYDPSTRSYQEQYNDSARPAISGTVENIGDYDIIFIGYPIWYGRAPKIIYTFMESYDFSGKTVIPFCTSGGSGIDNAVGNKLTDATVLPGRRFSGGASESAVAEWVSGLSLPVN